MSEFSLCPTCGGATGDMKMARKIYGKAGLIFKPCLCEMPPVVPAHPAPAPRHNGRLDDRLATHDYHATVELQEDYALCDGSKVVVIAGGRGDCENSRVLLEPAQALSLRDWLIQNTPELEQLAKEQK